MPDEIRRRNGYGYFDKHTNRICMIQCFECGNQNYTPTIASGLCAWCDYNPNAESEKIEQKITFGEEWLD